MNLDLESHHLLSHNKAFYGLCTYITIDSISETKEIRRVTTAKNGCSHAVVIDKQVSTPHTICTIDHQWKETVVLPLYI